jgi:hypothetical protein
MTDNTYCGGCHEPADATLPYCPECGFPDGSVMLERGWTLTRHELAEQRMLDFMENAGLELPDLIEHDDHAVRFFWNHKKVVVVLSLDDDDAETTR